MYTPRAGQERVCIATILATNIKHDFFIGYYGEEKKQKLDRGEELEGCVWPEFSETHEETEGKGTRHYVGSC